MPDAQELLGGKAVLAAGFYGLGFDVTDTNTAAGAAPINDLYIGRFGLLGPGSTRSAPMPPLSTPGGIVRMLDEGRGIAKTSSYHSPRPAKRSTGRGWASTPAGSGSASTWATMRTSIRRSWSGCSSLA